MGVAREKPNPAYGSAFQTTCWNMREREGRLKNQPQRLPSFPPPPKRGQAAAGMAEAARQLSEIKAFDYQEVNKDFGGIFFSKNNNVTMWKVLWSKYEAA
ncbi:MULTISPECIES: hypothetical protein [unclassified Neisseria]